MRKRNATEAKVFTLRLIAMLGLASKTANLGTTWMERVAAEGNGERVERKALGRVPPVREEKGKVLGARGKGRARESPSINPTRDSTCAHAARLPHPTQPPLVRALNFVQGAAWLM